MRRRLALVVSWLICVMVTGSAYADTLIDVCGIYASSPRIIEFAGQQWYVKKGFGDPGQNRWSDSADSVWVDAGGSLHLKIRNINGLWHSAEVCAVQPTHLGSHRFRISTPNLADKTVVVGLFLYRDYRNAELDIEYTKWTANIPPSAQYVVQPYNRPGDTNIHYFGPHYGDTTHYIDWCRDYVRFKSFDGHQSEPPNASMQFNQWWYGGADNPPEAKNLRHHINLWLPTGAAISSDVEITIADVTTTAVSDSFQAPALVNPANGFLTGNTTLNFGWNAAASTGVYRLQIDNAPDFLTPVRNLVLDSSAYQTTLPGGFYYWRVQALNCDNMPGDWSNIHTLLINSGSPPGIAPGRNYFTSAPILSWENIPWAVEYEVQVDASAAFALPYDYRTVVPGGTLAVMPGLPNGRYYWRVRARHSGGWGSWSAVEGFLLNAP